MVYFIEGEPKSSAEERLKELEKSQNKREEDFLKQIGSLTVELNWAKKKLKEAGLGDQNGLD